MQATFETESATWREAPVPELIQHLLDTHHVVVRQLMERAGLLAAKVASAHGPNHPELIELAGLVRAFCDDLGLHLRKEEEILFPAIQHLYGAGGHPAHCPVPAPIAAMRHEHQTAQRDLARMRELTDNYTAPEDACGSFRAYYADLQAIEADTLLHIRKENEILFERVMARFVS